MSFTLEELRSAIEDNDHVVFSEYRGENYTIDADEWYSELKHGTTRTVSLDGREYVVERVAEFGGMDEGSDYWVVFSVDGRLFRKSGWYASHDGGYLDGALEEVEPFERTVTDYRAV